MTTKTFDCVAMKHRGAEAVARHLDGKTPEEQLAYWQERTEALRARQQARRQAVHRPENHPAGEQA